MTDKKKLFEKIARADLLTEDEMRILTEAPDYGQMFSMYGEKAPKEKNLNRVIAGMKAFDMANPTQQLQMVGQPTPTGVGERTIQILELQIKKLLSDQKDLHNRYVSMIRNQNQLVARINQLSELVRNIEKDIER